MTARPPKRFLIKSAYAPRTISDYTASLNRFLSWCRDQGEDPSLDRLDLVFTDWLHDLYDEQAAASGKPGTGKSIGVKALCGLNLVLPESKSRMHLSSLALRGWSKLAPRVSYPPITWELTCLVAVRLARLGHQRAAIGTLLSFDCLLRVGELCGLRREDIADVKDPRIGSVPLRMNLRLRTTKTGPNKWVQLSDVGVEKLVRLLLAATKPGELVFPYSTDRFRTLFKSACADMKLSESYVPHSLRHGGATRMFQQGRDMKDIMLRGRWASDTAARTYIQSGASLLLTLDVDQQAHELGKLFSEDVVLSLALAQEH